MEGIVFKFLLFLLECYQMFIYKKAKKGPLWKSVKKQEVLEIFSDLRPIIIELQISL